MISVKQAKSGSWYVTNGTAGLGRYGCTTWFSTDAEVRAAADAFALGCDDWHWVRRNEAA
jgi:hypothetical protein